MELLKYVDNLLSVINVAETFILLFRLNVVVAGLVPALKLSVSNHLARIKATVISARSQAMSPMRLTKAAIKIRPAIPRSRS